MPRRAGAKGRGGDWSEGVRLAATVARHQGMSHKAIAAALSEALGREVSPKSIRYLCFRHGATQRREARWIVPAGYEAEYIRLRGILGVVKARAEIALLVVRDEQRRAASAVRETRAA